MHSTFSEKFGNEISLAEFKSHAESAIVTENGRRCTRHEFATESNKRKQSTKDYVEENTLRDLKLYTKARDQLLLEKTE